jgi:amino acid transporter
MAYAFARDGGLPFSKPLRTVHPVLKTPVCAIWTVAAASFLFTIYSPVYSTITAVCTISLYISYVLPIAIGFVVYRQSWKQMGPWDLGQWFRPLALVSVLYCTTLLVIGMQPPNEKSLVVLASLLALLLIGWFLAARKNFVGPPHVMRELRHSRSDAATDRPRGIVESTP